jgi:outer membrane protein assembly factor BamB
VSNGHQLWRTYLNQTTTANCRTTRGVSSTPTVVGGAVYLGGGGTDWYALNASSGAVLWKVYVGNNSLTGGHYNWASPLIYRGNAYVGVASDCDTPLVQGGLLEVNLTSHLVSHVFNSSTKLAHGASVWGSPSVDPATNLVYIATGNGGQYGSSLIALNATTLALNGSWQVPANQSIFDGDFGGTPTVFAGTAGHQYVGVANKNGVFYAFDDSRVSAGPVWELPIAVAGDCPECGQGSISPAAFDGTSLFVAGGRTTIDGTNFSGSVRAVNPATGMVLWQHGSPGAILGGLASVGGMIFDSAGPDLEILNSSTGARLLSYPADATLYTSPSVAEGLVFVSSAAGTTYALAPSTGHWRHLFTPPAVSGASLAYDAGDGYVVQFGGCAADLCPSSETWTWAGGTWTNVTPTFLNSTNSPSPRVDAGIAYDAADAELVLFGGHSPGTGSDLGDTWSFHAGAWKLVAASGGPSARSAVAMAYDPAIGDVVLFGGAQHAGANRSELGDTWEFSGGKWTAIKVKVSQAPSARDAASLAYYPSDRTVVVFGGRSGGTVENDTWELAGSKWNPLHSRQSPPPLYGASLDYDNGSGDLLLFGGHAAAESVVSATWTYSAGTWRAGSSTTLPSARWDAGLTFDVHDGYSLLSGGQTTNGQPLADAWKHTSTGWTHEFPSSPGAARYGAGAAYDASDGYLVVFGGQSASGFYSNTMRFSGTGYPALCAGCVAGKTEPSARDFPAMAYDAADSEVVLFGGQGPAGALRDTWTFSSGAWTNLTAKLSLAPSARSGASFAYDRGDGALVLFGGRGTGGVVNDTWEFQGGAWTRVSTGVAPSAREGAAMAYDAATASLVLFGGNSSRGTFADTWEFSAGAWSRAANATGPSARSYAGLASLNESGSTSALLVGGVANTTYLSDVWMFVGGSWVPVFRGVTPTVRAGAVVEDDPALGEVVVYGGETGAAGVLFAAGDTWTFGVTP